MTQPTADQDREHNLGWKQKVLTWDWYKVALDGYPGWDLDNINQGRASTLPR